MGTAKAYMFRVYSHSATSYTVGKEIRYQMPENVKRDVSNLAEQRVPLFLRVVSELVLSYMTNQ